MARYRVIQLSTGSVHEETELPTVAADAVRVLTATGIDSDDLDVIDTQSGTSILARAHDSVVRRFAAESGGVTYRSFRNLTDAKAAPLAALIIEGDYGGQILATCPVRLIGCSDDRLHCLAAELQDMCWGEPHGAGLQFEPLGAGDRVAGGMGGGLVTDALWLHEELIQLGMRGAIEAVLTGAKEVLGPPQPDVPDEVRAAIIRAYHERVDVYCHAFGFEGPGYLYTMHIDEWRRREQAAVPPPASYSKWYAATFKSVVAQAGLPLGPA